MSPKSSSRRFAAAAVGVFALALLLPASALADRETAIATGPGWNVIEATMTYKAYGTEGAGREGSMRLTVKRDDQRAFDRFPAPRCEYCGLFNGFPSAVQILQLDATPEPEIIFNIYSGGAHCCDYSLILRFVDGRYETTTHFWGNSPYRFRKLNGQPRLVNRDDRFAYRFDCYACSRFPIQIWAFRNGSMRDVTRGYPNLIRRDARGHKRAWRRAARRGQAAAPIAAWAADQCLLGKCSSAKRKARSLARNGAVSAFYPNGRRGFIPKLNRTLRRFGYSR